MLKDTLVDLILDDATSAVQKVYDISYMEHLPVGISAKRASQASREMSVRVCLFLVVCVQATQPRNYGKLLFRRRPAPSWPRPPA